MLHPPSLKHKFSTVDALVEYGGEIRLSLPSKFLPSTGINPNGSFPRVAKNAFFDEKCDELKGACKKHCEKNEELTSFCQKSLKCCRTIQTCGNTID
ncbi:beta-defensin 106A-like [Chlorocebus sabaeus]|uniref:beta-defensin 106A-like n=1 Tax=Chlorocebus sabaeus TaxID=60711 RepID=UPI0018B07E30|nr:beta-defensin 106A-like [Chlorocebus sabaeus]